MASRRIRNKRSKERKMERKRVDYAQKRETGRSSNLVTFFHTEAQKAAERDRKDSERGKCQCTGPQTLSKLKTFMKHTYTHAYIYICGIANCIQTIYVARCHDAIV